MPALIIKPWLILVTHTDDLDWYITSNQQGQMFVWNLNLFVSKLNVTARADPVLHHRLYSLWLDVSGKLSYWHTSSEQPEPSKWIPTERIDLSYLSVLQQQPVLGRVPPRKWVGQRQLRSQKLQLHNRLWWKNSTTPDDAHHTMSGRTGSALAWPSEGCTFAAHWVQGVFWFAAHVALAIRGAQGILPCVEWGMWPVNWIYLFSRHCRRCLWSTATWSSTTRSSSWIFVYYIFILNILFMKYLK